LRSSIAAILTLLHEQRLAQAGDDLGLNRQLLRGPLAKTAFERGAEKLPIKTKVIARLGESLAAEEE
jgi:hypothetical protein